LPTVSAGSFQLDKLHLDHSYFGEGSSSTSGGDALDSALDLLLPPKESLPVMPSQYQYQFSAMSYDDVFASDNLSVSSGSTDATEIEQHLQDAALDGLIGIDDHDPDADMGEWNPESLLRMSEPETGVRSAAAAASHVASRTGTWISYGNISELGDVSGSLGKSSLFLLTARPSLESD
jgi:hypothetical protein